MVKDKSFMFMVGPDVIKAVQNETVTFEELGGASVHASRSGSAHFVAEDDLDCIRQVKKLVSYLPSNNLEQPPRKPMGDDPERREDSLDTIIPEDPMKPYDMKEVIRKVVDKGELFEVQEQFARNIITAFARMDGAPWASWPTSPWPWRNAGRQLLAEGSPLRALLRSFNIPVVTLVDVPGYMPSVEQENGSLLRDSTKLLYAYAEASVPKSPW
jgi:acetyl-CoA carboxylase carboxyltransferase component